MLFNSINFLIFFPVVTLIYFLLPRKIKNYWLLVASYFFYMCWNPKYILLLLTSTFVTYLSGLAIERIKQQKYDTVIERKYKNYVVAASFTINIGLLFYFKYINFALEVLESVFGAIGITLNIPAFDIVLPVGISFYIFQALSYTMDVYRDEIYAEKNFFRYALFVSFFPQLVAGPIERSKNLLRQLAEPKCYDYDNVRTGLLTMLWGYFIKIVLADRLGILVDTVYANPDAYHGMQVILANLGFTLQIYCDFMGYSIIARGAAKVLGYNLMSNFEMPYFANSIRDFWRRWHISLSSWLRDYLYIPLGGNRRGLGRKYFNLLLTFFVSGLWHGASITFVVWGLFHGICQVIEDLFRQRFGVIKDRIETKHLAIAWNGINVFKTFIIAAIGWVFFRADTLRQAVRILRSSLILDNVRSTLSLDGLSALSIGKYDLIIILIGILLLVVVSIMREKKINVIEWVSARFFLVRYPMYWLVLTMILFSLDLTGKEFIYFQF